MKRLFLIFAILAISAPAFAGNLVYFALQKQTGANGDYYHLINTVASQTKDIPANQAVSTVTSGAWQMVAFDVDSIRPAEWTRLRANYWLSQCDGYLAPTIEMIAEHARLDHTITNRAFNYQTVLNAIRVYRWITDNGDGTYALNTGDVAAWEAAGYPKAADFNPEPVRFE